MREGGITPTGAVKALRTAEITRRERGGIREEVSNQQELDGLVEGSGESQEKGRERSSVGRACYVKAEEKPTQVKMRPHVTFEATPTIEKWRPDLDYKGLITWLVWLSGLNAGLRTKGSPVGFPVGAHAWVVPSKGRMRGNHTLMFLSLSFSFPSPLSKNK